MLHLAEQHRQNDSIDFNWLLLNYSSSRCMEPPKRKCQIHLLQVNAKFDHRHNSNRQEYRHKMQTLKFPLTLSQPPLAMRRFSGSTAMSATSLWCPLNVDIKRPSWADHVFRRQSSAPCKYERKHKQIKTNPQSWLDMRCSGCVHTNIVKHTVHFRAEWLYVWSSDIC